MAGMSELQGANSGHALSIERAYLYTGILP
jgi:hypothetical protein